MSSLFNQLQRFCRILGKFFSHPVVREFACGALAAALLLVTIGQFVLLYGVSDVIVTAGTVTCGIAAGLLLFLRHRLKTDSAYQGLAWILSGCWLVLLPVVLAASQQYWTLISVNDLTGPTSIAVFAISMLTSATALMPGISLAVLLPTPGGFLPFALGMAVCSWLAPVVWFGANSMGLWMLGLGLAASILGTCQIWNNTKSGPKMRTGIDPGLPAVNEPGFMVRGWLAVVVTTASGGAVAVILHVSRQWIVASMPSLAGSWGGGLLGLAIGYWWVKRGGAVRSHSSTLYLTAAWGLGLCICGFGFMAASALWSTAWISQLWVLYLVRWLIVAIPMILVGLAAGAAAGHSQQRGWGTLLIVCAVAGFLGTYWSNAHPIVLASLCGGVLLLASLYEWLSERRLTKTWLRSFGKDTSSAGRIRKLREWALPFIAAMLVLAAMLMSGRYRPEQSEKFLFAGGAFAAYRQGISIAELPFLDDGRLVTSIDTPRGRFSLWKHRGMQFAVRRNGIPVGWSSAAPELGPDNLSEVVAVTIPLTMHANCRRVLLLGAEGYSSLSTALSFPVQHVACASVNPQSSSQIEDLASRSTLAGLMQDVRLRQLPTDPALLAHMAPGDETYDVIIGQSTQAALLENTAVFTQQHFQGLRRRMSDQGIFCQRLSYLDFGPSIVQRLVSTLSSVFPQVVVTEIVPGELLLIGSLSKDTLFNTSTVERLQAEHVRDVLARVGWDWSMIANLGAVSSVGCSQFSAGQPVVDAARDGIVFTLPGEVSRWGEKWSNTRGQLAARAEVLGNWLGDVPEVDEIRQRLEDVKLARQIVDENPDQFWAYRAAIKTRLQKRPRTELIQVRNEGLRNGLHSEDQRRKDYLATLGDAAAAVHPNSSQVVLLHDFQQPYDPLVTYFLHQEAASLLQRSVSAEPGLQLSHWLHSIYFAPAQDRSVRHLCSALKLIHDEPGCLADPAARFDHLNGLLEMLRYRWSLRLQGTTRSRYEPIDTEQSITMTRQTLDDMDQLCETAGISRADWKMRRTVLEEQLLRPLRAHRSEQAGQYTISPQAAAKSTPPE